MPSPAASGQVQNSPFLGQVLHPALMSLGLREDKSCIFTTHMLDVLTVLKAGSPSVVGSSLV